MRRFLVGLGALVLLLGVVVRGARSPIGHADTSTERPFPISASWPLGVQAFLRVETSAPVFNVLYSYGQNKASASGAYGPNASLPRSAWYLEYQRAGAVDLIAGVLRGDDSLISEGLRIFHFGLARQGSDGLFPGSAWPFHGTAMFLAEAAPALVLLGHSPQQSTFSSELRWESGRMRRAAYAMVRSVHGPGKIDDTTKNHRWFEAALALGGVGTLTGDRTLIQWSTRYAWRGIDMERRDGMMPEDGGHDSGYQALGLTDAARYLELVATGRLQRSLFQAIRKGEAWEISRVRKNGTIDQSGDTRTVGCRELDPAGACKTTFYAPIFDALMRWSVIARDTHYERLAYWVWLQNWQRVPGDFLPKPGVGARPVEIRPGQWLTVWGAGFQPLETVRVYLGSSLVQTIDCDQIGSFGAHSPQPNAYFAVPALSPGRYSITVRGSYGTVRQTTITIAS